jgi:transcriptional regulator with XRE-family HTH domain
MLGRRIRALRSEQGMTVSELASAIGVTPSAVSQIERGSVDPSLRSLRAIAGVLDTPLSSFFLDPSPAGIVVRKDERLIFSSPKNEGIRYELLSPGLDRELEMVFMCFDPGESSADRPLPHSGDECLVVLKGEANVTVADQAYVLSEGDSIYIDKGLAHQVANIGDTPLECIACFTPFSF